MTKQGIRTRFAPSPTGSLHIGGIRTALYSLLWARRHRGTFVLRIEDTDRVRSTDEAARGIVRDMRWLGLYWDEGPERDHPQFGPYYQSERLPVYERHARELLDAGKAYEAWESSAELDAERKAAEADKKNYRYHRRPYTPDQIAAFRAEGRKPVIRLAAPGHGVTVNDQILGEVVVEAEGLDDFVLVKADGFPTYHFAVVVDDHHMEIDLVLRGQEHLMNTHRHLLIYEAFGWQAPEHGHLPLIFNATGSKMSKRDKAKVAREAARALAKQEGRPTSDWTWLAERAGLAPDDVARFMAKQHDGVAAAEAIARALGAELPLIEVQDFRRAGYIPEAVINYLALLGWSPGDGRDILSFQDLLASFDVARVIKTPARFDIDRLNWMNAEYMKSLPDDQLHHRLLEWLEAVDSPVGRLDEAHQRQLLAMYRPRARTFSEIHRLGRFLFERPTRWDPKQVEKHLAGDGRLRLVEAERVLGNVATWDGPTLEVAFQTMCATQDVGIGAIAQPVRIALTGDGVSPEIYDTLAFLGKAETLARIEACLAATRGLGAPAR